MAEKPSKTRLKSPLSTYRTEALLWLLFFFVVGGVGFIQGWKPDFRFKFLFKNPPEVQVLTISSDFFSPEWITETERKTESKIIIHVIKDWEDLHLQLITNADLSLLFIPSHWAQTLHQESLLNDEVDYVQLGNEKLAPDFRFQPQSYAKDYFPVYWAKLSLYAKAAPAKANLKQQNLAFLDDADSFVAWNDELGKNKIAESFIKAQWRIFPLSSWIQREDFTQDYFLAPHPLKSEHPEWQTTTTPELMYLLGFSLPKNGAHPGTTWAVLKEYIANENQTKMVQQGPFASTLASIEAGYGSLDKKPSYLRSLGLHSLIMVRSHEAEALASAQKTTNSRFSY